MPSPPSEPPWSPPSAFDGYELVREIGRGGMGRVYLARDTLLDRQVAVKFLAREPNQVARQRFLVEARAIARLQHPNVVSIYRVGEASGFPYLVSELVRGAALDKLEAPLDWTRALALGMGIARGLAAAHRRGVVHRDIKPANVIVSEDGEAKLLDFGLARLVANAVGRVAREPRATSAHDEDETPMLVMVSGSPTRESLPCESIALTTTGAVLGTPAYIAPEVWRGDAATFRSDVYSLGALLYTVCTGAPPHVASRLRELRAAALERDVMPLAEAAPGIDPRFGAIVDRCLRRDASERYGSGNELRAALAELTPEARATSVPRGNPYRGLAPFEAEHRALYFGRDSELRGVLERLRACPAVVVAGDSGVGKSSLCRAGVLPRIGEWLADGRSWTSAVLVPGRHPALALAVALAPTLGAKEEEVLRLVHEDPSELARLLRGRMGTTKGFALLVDPLEELVTIADRREAAAVADVLGWLASPAPGVRLLAAARGDFLGRVAALEPLGEALLGSLYFVRALSVERVRDAILGPARAVGVALESDELVSRLVASTGSARGGLPLLQLALAELWEARGESGAITVEMLASLGGVEGALRRHADRVLAHMGQEQQRAARAMLERLGDPRATAEGLTEDELASTPIARAALEVLVRGRLVVAREVGEGHGYEIAHAALRRGAKPEIEPTPRPRERSWRVAFVAFACALSFGAGLVTSRALRTSASMTRPRADVAAPLAVARGGTP